MVILKAALGLGWKRNLQLHYPSFQDSVIPMAMLVIADIVTEGIAINGSPAYPMEIYQKRWQPINLKNQTKQTNKKAILYWETFPEFTIPRTHCLRKWLGWLRWKQIWETKSIFFKTVKGVDVLRLPLVSWQPSKGAWRRMWCILAYSSTLQFMTDWS